jgi:hypothetical protein
MKKTIGVALLVLALFLVFKPNDHSKENSIQVNGVVKNITEGGVNDAVFELENDSITYYINRRLENGSDLAALKKEFLGKTVSIWFTNSWTPLAPFGTKSKHITQLKSKDSIIYTEFK